MKTILIDAVHTFVSDTGVIDQKLYELLEEFKYPKIICTNAPIEKFEQYGFDRVPYPVFTLSKDPSKLDPNYFNMLLDEYSIFASECIYFEHNKDAVASAQSIGITSYHFDKEKRDLRSLELFLRNNLH